MEQKISVVCSGFLENDICQFLFLKRSNVNSWGVGQFQLPEGKMEWGEKPEETLIRETKEETDGKPTELSLTGYSTFQLQAKGNDYHVVRLIFKGKFEVEGDIKLSEDHTLYSWLSLDEALMADLVPGIKEFITTNLMKKS